MSERTSILQYLTIEFTEPVRDPIWKHIYLSPAFTKIIQTKVFQKLHAIKQLGPAYLIYPGAAHSRFSHSLGVFHLSRRMITSLAGKDTEGILTLNGVKAFLCAALLHDLGHYPFAHSLKDLDVMEHEALTARQIIETPDLFKIIKDEIRISPHYVAAIVDLQYDQSVLKGEAITNLELFRSLLSGVLDPDKLDYLNRDAYFCGVPYGNQDVDFIYNEIVLNTTKGLAISLKGLPSVESLLFSKYLMYKNVYWHKNVRILTAMIKKAILLALKEKVITAENLYGMTDQELLHFAEVTPFKPFRLITEASHRQLYTPVFKIPFNPANPLHLRLESLAEKLEFEIQLAKYLSRQLKRPVKVEEIIIDVPERISFEIDVPIIEEDKETPFREAGSVFTEEIINGFCQSLRHISVLAAESSDLINALKKSELKAIFEENIQF